MSANEITPEERKKLDQALYLIADVQVAFTKREEAKPRDQRNGWWSELYKCRTILGEYLYASQKREEYFKNKA